MEKDIEAKMMEFMKPLFGDMARQTIENQKMKLSLTTGELSYEDYVKVAESIRDLCMKMAGNGIANKIHSGLMEILEKEKN